MTLDKSRFNINPYYDDFDESKKFLQMLFKPGFAVQARELTQLQTILSNQIGRMADHIFEDGDVIKGAGITERTLKFIRLANSGDSKTVEIDELIGYDLEYTHTISTPETENEIDPLHGTETTVIGKVIHALESTSGDPYKILFIDVLQGSMDQQGEFLPGQNEITTTNLNINPTLSILEWEEGYIDSEYADPTGKAIIMSIEEGLFYVDGYFIMNDAQKLPIFETNEYDKRMFTPSDRTVSCGFKIERDTVSADTDVSLRDPSQGSYNYNAPGADRYKVELTVHQIPYIFDELGFRTDFDTDNYFEWARIIEGQTFKTIKYPEYAELEETFARRTFDESGHYTVVPFGAEAEEYTEVWDPANTDVEGQHGGEHWKYMAIGLKSGKAYVRGYEFESQATEYLVGERARTIKHQDDRIIDIDFGNYVLVEHNLDGTTPLFLTDGLFAEDGAVNLVGGNQTKPEYKQINLSIQGAEGEMVGVGCANIYQIAPHAYYQGEGGVGTLYRVYLNDIRIGSDAGFSESADLMNIQDIRYLADPTTGKKMFTIHIPDGKTEPDGLEKKGMTDLIYKIPVGRCVKQITGIDYHVQRDWVFDISYDGTAQAWKGSIVAPDESEFLGTPGLMDDLTNISEYLVSVDGYLFDMNIASTGDYGGNYIELNDSLNELTVYISSDATSEWTGDSKKCYLLTSLHHKQEQTGGGSFSESSSLRQKILKRKELTITNNSNADGVLGMWNSHLSKGYGINLGYPDVFQIESITEIGTNEDFSDQFTLDNGQKTHIYDHASIYLDRGTPGGTFGVGDDKPWESEGAGFKVKFLYFDHQHFSQPDPSDYTLLKYPLAVNSYIHSDHEVQEIGIGPGFSLSFGNTADSQNEPPNITTYNHIPRFSDSKRGETLDLTDAIDFRPIRVGRWDENHSEYKQIRGVWTPQDGKPLSVDYDHYLPRIDKLVLTKDREFKIIKGIPSENPTPPEHDEREMMLLYYLIWDAYTHTPNNVKFQYVDNQRYTMEDIGNLESRIKVLEKTTTLSKSETDTKIEASQYGDQFTNAMSSDEFTTLKSCDIESADHSVAFNSEEGEMQPAQATTNINLIQHTKKSLDSGITASGDNIYTLTPSSTGISTVNNLTGNIPIHPNPFAKTNWMGNLKLSPSSDDWLKITTPPKTPTQSDWNDAYLTAVRRKTKGMAGGFAYRYNWWHHGGYGCWGGRYRWGYNNQQVSSYDTFGGNRNWNSPVWGGRYRGYAWHYSGHYGRNRYGNAEYKKQWSNYKRACNLITSNYSYRHRCANFMAANHGKLKDRGYFDSPKPGKPTHTYKVRGRKITLTAENMKPNVKYYCYINNKPVTTAESGYGRVVDSTNNMRTDTNGNAYLEVRIPNDNPYTQGRLQFRITDAEDNDAVAATTTAEALYVVGGKLNSSDSNITSTREIVAKRDSVNAERITQDTYAQAQVQLSNVADYFDPLAQVFEVDSEQYPKGIFASGVDLFFREYDPGNLPFAIEIRPLINGSPHPTTPIPLSEVVKTTGFQTQYSGPDISDVNNFKFTTPLYLKPGKYAIIMKTNSTKYTLWGTQFGNKGITSDGSVLESNVERQPYTGNMFLPQNNGSRWEIGNQQVMFRVNRCRFPVGANPTLHLEGTTADTVNSSADIVYSPLMHEITLLSEYTADPATTITHMFYPGSDAETKIELPVNSPFTLPQRKDFDLTDQNINSNSILETTMSTSDENVTPVVDMDRFSIIASVLQFSNDVTNELEPEAPVQQEGDPAVARYIGRTVDTGNEANYVRVSFDATKKSETGVKVYAKVLGLDDDSILNNNWEEMTGELSNAGIPANNENDEFHTYKYYLKKTDGFRSFAVKLVLTGNPLLSDVSRVKSLKQYALYDPDIDTSIDAGEESTDDTDTEDTD